MNRRVLPIGQGNFAIEKFSDFTAVFDCGSKTDIALVHEEIDKNFFDGEKIDTVFVSHLDCDHINGIDYLIKKCTVKSIVIPYLYRELILISFIYNKLFNIPYNTSSFLSFIYDNILENEGQIRSYENIKIVQIPAFTLDLGRVNLDEIDEAYYNSVIDIMSKINEMNPDWLFLPFNFDASNRSKLFYEAISTDSDLASLSVDELAKNWNNPDYIDKLKKIFKSKKISGSINDNSMVVYSGPIIRRYNELYYVNESLFHRTSCNCFKNEIGAIYMGDYSAHKKNYYNEFMKFYDRYINYVGLIVMPHHGSVNGYNESLPIDFDCVFLISYGTTYSHACEHSVLKDILAKGRRIILVNEKSVVFEQIIL
jgi:hypothetical protein